MNEKMIEDLLERPPLVHDWGSGPTAGGMEGEIARELVRYLKGAGADFVSTETGGGVSSLLFLACDPFSHVTICPEQKVKDRLDEEIQARGLDTRPWTYHLDFSEYIVPKMIDRATDIALIDGGHGWPCVFVDFCYLNMALKKGGIIVVDDIQMFSCGELFKLLKHQPGFKLEKVVWQKTAFFRKETDARLLPDFGGQPYILNSDVYHGVPQ